MLSRSLKAAAFAAVLSAATVTTAGAYTVYQLSIESQIISAISRAQNAGLARIIANPRGQMYVDGGNTGFDVYLEAGAEYFIAARCDQDCRDLALGITDPNGNIRVASSSQRDFPEFVFRPAVTGTHRVTLGLAHCSAYRCQVGAVVMGR